MERYYRELDYRKLVFYILYRWKLLIAFALAGGIGLFGLKYITVGKDDSYANKDDYNVVEESLSDEERGQVDKIVVQYNTIMASYEYIEKSLMMSIDPYNESRITLQLLVIVTEPTDAGSEEKENLTHSLLDSYRAYIESGSLACDISKEMNGKINEEYINELISVHSSLNDDAVSMGNCLTIALINNSQIDKFEEIVLKMLDNYRNSLKRSIGEHELQLIDSWENTVYDSDLLNDQRNYAYNLTATENRVKEALSTFTEVQKKYYNYKIGIGEESEDAISDTPANFVNPVFFVLGVCGGLFCIILFLVIKYLVSTNIISEQDYYGMFHIKPFGTIFATAQQCNSINSFIQRFEYGEDLFEDFQENISYIALKIKLACKINKVEKIACISSDFSKLSENIFNDLYNALEKERITLVKIDKLLMNAKAMDELFDIGYCIMIEQTEHSQMNKIQRTVDFCGENDIKILGVVNICLISRH